MGGQAAGYAAADAVQALPHVSTFWAIVLFGEYRKSSRRTYILLGSMLFLFIGESLVWYSSLITSLSESILCTGLKMYLVESKGGAILCMLLALFFLWMVC